MYMQGQTDADTGQFVNLTGPILSTGQSRRWGGKKEERAFPKENKTLLRLTRRF